MIALTNHYAFAAYDCEPILANLLCLDTDSAGD
jgi:hypothetical protein